MYLQIQEKDGKIILEMHKEYSHYNMIDVSHMIGYDKFYILYKLYNEYLQNYYIFKDYP